MTIAQSNFEAIGARVYTPEGPYGAAGQTPLPSQKFGAVAAGDSEGEFVFLKFAPTTSVTVHQGDVMIWDHTYLASPIITPGAAGGMGGIGLSVGTFFLGARVGDPGTIAAEGMNYSYTFAAGVYGIWVQRAGTSLINVGSITSQVTNAVSTTTAGQISQIAQSGHAMVIAGSTAGGGAGGFVTVPQTITFTCSTTNNSAQLTSVTPINGNTLYMLEVGMVLTGTGIATSPAPVITDIQGGTIVMSIAATATGSSITVTAKTQQFVAIAGVSGAYTVTATALSNIYPGQTLSGTNIGSSAIVNSITGTPGNYTLTLSVANSGTVANATVTATGYYVGYLRWPYITASA